ncbi:hypothetical protein [Henriciella sp.]|uniref:hypothetical protein n=1 Tax=Henriciella sp. TaxID=1968823 RepID=UPI002632D92C|nr:hypothetical protein [Henriciella sp.]
MSTRGHRNFLSAITSWIFGSAVFRHRWIRWPLAVVLAGLAVHSITSGGVADSGDRGAAVPALLFLFAIFLILLPLLPLADEWDERGRRD